VSDKKSTKLNKVSTESTNQQSARKKKKKKKTALVICRDRKEFWTTQTQFWQWVREGIVTKTAEQPLTGSFNREHEELLVLLSNTVLNLAHPNHMREALLSRKVGIPGR
jgi:adenine-specific DNA methylase